VTKVISLLLLLITLNGCAGYGNEIGLIALSEEARCSIFMEHEGSTVYCYWGGEF